MFAAFPIALFIVGGIILIGLPVTFSLQAYYKNRGRRSVICPENHQSVNVEADRKFAFWTAFRGQEHTRLQSCTRWPEMHECGQECLVQVEPTPENLDRLLTKWFDGKPCSICGRLLTSADWRFGRMGFLNEDFELVEMRQLDLDSLGSIAQPTRPLCWSCHQQEKQRHQPIPVASFDREKLKA